MEYVEPNIFKLSKSDYQLEEPRQDIHGFDVYDSKGEQIGSVADFYIDREVHVTRFVDVSAGGFLKIGKKHFLIPVEEFARDMSEEERVRVNHDRDKVLNSPDFDPDEVPDLDFQHTIYAYYGRPIPESSSTTKITSAPSREVLGNGLKWCLGGGRAQPQGLSLIPRRLLPPLPRRSPDHALEKS